MMMMMMIIIIIMMTMPYLLMLFDVSSLPKLDISMDVFFVTTTKGCNSRTSSRTTWITSFFTLQKSFKSVPSIKITKDINGHCVVMTLATKTTTPMMMIIIIMAMVVVVWWLLVIMAEDWKRRSIWEWMWSCEWTQESGTTRTRLMRAQMKVALRKSTKWWRRRRRWWWRRRRRWRRWPLRWWWSWGWQKARVTPGCHLFRINVEPPMMISVGPKKLLRVSAVLLLSCLVFILRLNSTLKLYCLCSIFISTNEANCPKGHSDWEGCSNDEKHLLFIRDNSKMRPHKQNFVHVVVLSRYREFPSKIEIALICPLDF